MNAIEFHDVTLSLGGRSILSGISLQIGAGEFVGMLGPNGAGKTTFMRAILGLVRPNRGNILVLGHTATRGNPAIGYVPQVRSNIGAIRLSGWDFVAGTVNGHRLGLPILSKAARRDVDHALERVGARDLSRRALSELSGGERQRLLMAQALVGHPQMLLLDEPLNNLDPRHQQALIDLVKSLQTELGITILFSSHELNPLLGSLDRVLYLGSGHAALGSVDEVIAGPILSRLYGSEIEVVHVNGRIFIVADGHEIEHAPHRHPDSASSSGAGTAS